MLENIEEPRKKGGNPNMRKGEPSVNPLGRTTKGLQSFKDRLTHWLETKTILEIEQIVENPKKWNKLSAIDALVARRIHAASKASGGNDMTIILDRLLGKPAITADLQVTHALANRLDEAEKLLGSPANPITLIGEALDDDA